MNLIEFLSKAKIISYFHFSLIDNNHTQSILIYEKIKMSEKVNVCELCREQPVSVLCAECCKCYCDRCNKAMHAILKGHKVEAIPEGVVANARCSLHDDEPLRLFCIDEVKLCCHACTQRSFIKATT